jgi:hypothetical protein
MSKRLISIGEEAEIIAGAIDGKITKSNGA